MRVINLMVRYEEIYNTIEEQDIHHYVNNNTDNECVASANLYKRENAKIVSKRKLK